MAGRIILDADVPTMATMPHGNPLAVVLTPSGDRSECCDFSFHCVTLVVVVRVYCTKYARRRQPYHIRRSTPSASALR